MGDLRALVALVVLLVVAPYVAVAQRSYGIQLSNTTYCLTSDGNLDSPLLIARCSDTAEQDFFIDTSSSPGMTQLRQRTTAGERCVALRRDEGADFHVLVVADCSSGVDTESFSYNLKTLQQEDDRVWLGNRFNNHCIAWDDSMATPSFRTFETCEASALRSLAPYTALMVHATVHVSARCLSSKPQSEGAPIQVGDRLAFAQCAPTLARFYWVYEEDVKRLRHYHPNADGDFLCAKEVPQGTFFTRWELDLCSGTDPGLELVDEDSSPDIFRFRSSLDDKCLSGASGDPVVSVDCSDTGKAVMTQLRCVQQYTNYNVSDQCMSCEGLYDIENACLSCITPRLDLSNRCSTCTNITRDLGKGCGVCRVEYAGEECEECAPGFNGTCRYCAGAEPCMRESFFPLMDRRCVDATDARASADACLEHCRHATDCAYFAWTPGSCCFGSGISDIETDWRAVVGPKYCSVGPGRSEALGCQACRDPRYSLDSDCQRCGFGLSLDDNCTGTVCTSGRWVLESGELGCRFCAGGFAESSGCAACRNGWTGDSCNVCPDALDPVTDCGDTKCQCTAQLGGCRLTAGGNVTQIWNEAAVGCAAGVTAKDIYRHLSCAAAVYEGVLRGRDCTRAWVRETAVLDSLTREDALLFDGIVAHLEAVRADASLNLDSVTLGALEGLAGEWKDIIAAGSGEGFDFVQQQKALRSGSDDNDGGDDDGLPVAAIAGIVVGGLVVLALAGASTIMLKRRQTSLQARTTVSVEDKL